MDIRLTNTAAVLGITLGCVLIAVPLLAQDAQQAQPNTQQEGQTGPPGAPGQFRGPRRGGAFGTIVSVGVNQLVIKRQDGQTTTVQVNSETKFLDKGKPIELEDLKPGDHVAVRAHAPLDEASGVTPPAGATSNPGAAPGANAAPAAILAASVARIPAGQGGPYNGGSFNAPRAFGRITAIDGNQLTLQSRQGERVITVASDAQIMKDGQAATLKDFKVGDPVMALGQENNGQFTATHVMSGQFRRGGQGYGGGQAPSGPPPPNP
ncbi:MAG TPA: DUF5666 domain-containing protein [Terriglobia bacterium]|nr:DUF5666 domain-containing protein [Terriglobia bacterium]